ncbi:glycoside hydrolase superfamily [Pilobolus umbonatus]|nr:glycoside hydrolase superfamily [Pilobolus umbonatus]
MREGEIITVGHYNNYLLENKYEIYVRYQRKIDAFRALGRLLGSARDPMVLSGLHDELVQFNEKAQFETQGVMIDCSRNGVLKPGQVYFLLCNMALMGLNMLQLYTEDTFEIEGEPLFGYMRGRYTIRELSLIDDYAFDLGIEVIPCIQTLGHMGQILRWQHYTGLRDTMEVLLPEAETTYEFIEKMIQTISRPFRSTRIHIGMDEAHGLGEGHYQQLYGYKEPSKIFLEHLQRVNDICIRNGLTPMLWSDMLFCLAANNNSLVGYYDPNNNPATPDLVDNLPSQASLIYWDYYHTTPDSYRQKIQQHRDMGCQQPWMATAAWTWSRFWTALPFSLQSIRACVNAAKSKEDGVQNIFITTWGDDGNECDVFSSLPALFYYAQQGYCEEEEVNDYLLRRNFEGICGANFDDWVYASKIDDTPSGIPITSRSTAANNMSKWLLWEDPMLSFLAPQYAEEDLEAHYQTIEDYLSKAIENKRVSNPLNERLELPLRIAKVLSLKCSLRKHCIAAYRKRDYESLSELAHGRINELRREVDSLWKYHRKMWIKTYKPFGWEVLEIRYGGLRARIETMFDRIIAHIDQFNQSKPMTDDDEDDEEDENRRIPEYEIDLQCVYYGAKTNLLLDYAHINSPSRPG